MHARSLAKFYCQYADRHNNLKFMRRVSEREPAIRQFVIVKNKFMSVFNASVLLLIMNFVITLSKWSADPRGYQRLNSRKPANRGRPQNRKTALKSKNRAKHWSNPQNRKSQRPPSLTLPAC